MNLNIMKLNSKLLYIIPFLCAYLAVHCAGFRQKKEMNNKVIVLNTDTIFTDTVVSYLTGLKLGDKEIKIENKFLYDKKQATSEIFNLRKYLGLNVVNNKSSINQFVSFKNSLCDNASWKVFTVFKGDSIDNPEGYNYKYIVNNKTEYYILNGYFFGCNGSLCNNGAILVLSFVNGKLMKGALFGIDKTIINLKTLKPMIKNNSLFLTIESDNNGKKKKLELSFGKEINLLSNGGLIDNGLSCIK